MTLPPLWPTDATTMWAALTAIFTGFAAVAAVVYAYLTSQILQRDQRPLLRLARDAQRDRLLVVKNIGRGPALGVALIDHEGAVLGFVDAVEPLAQGVGPESERSGRVEFLAEREVPRLPGFPLFLVYQDVGGRWYATKLVPDGARFRTRFFRIRWKRNVPDAVRAKLTVVSAFEDLGGVHVLMTEWERQKKIVRDSLRDGPAQPMDH